MLGFKPREVQPYSLLFNHCTMTILIKILGGDGERMGKKSVRNNLT